MRIGPIVALVAILIAGCAGPTSQSAADFSAAIVMDHDHNDHSLHANHSGLEFVAWNALNQTLGEQGFANFVFFQDGHELLAFVAIDGDDHGGFAIVNVTDAQAISVLGTYFVDGNSFQEVRVSPDGEWAVLNVQALPTEGNPTDGPDCTVCLHVVDVRDRANPRLSSVYPVELLGSHNLHFESYPEGTFLFFVHQPLYLPYPDPGNRITIAQFIVVAGEAALIPVSSFNHNTPDRSGRSFPHDVIVDDHPNGRKIAYVSHWDGGHVMFDVTNPLTPQKIAVHADATPSEALAIHWMKQERAPREDGAVIAWSAPEIGALESGTGVVRALDVRDPSAPQQLATWTLPGELAIEGQYRLSPHTTMPHPHRDLLAVTHYHAGVWVLNTANPRDPVAVAYYMPHGNPEAPYDGPIWWKKPNFNPEGFGPNVYQARWDPHDDNLLWVTDRGTGLYALRLADNLPG